MYRFWEVLIPLKVVFFSSADDPQCRESKCHYILCVSAIKYGLPCTGNTDKCVSNAECAEGVCKCDTTKSVPSSTGLCCKFSFFSNMKNIMTIKYNIIISAQGTL